MENIVVRNTFLNTFLNRTVRTQREFKAYAGVATWPRLHTFTRGELEQQDLDAPWCPLQFGPWVLFHFDLIKYPRYDATEM